MAGVADPFPTSNVIKLAKVKSAGRILCIAGMKKGLAATVSNVRTRGKIRHEEWPKITERFRKGETLAEIARSYRCTAPAIRYIVRRVEQDQAGHHKAESGVAHTPGESGSATPQIASVERLTRTGARRPSSAKPSTDAIWGCISSEIASFLVAMDDVAVNNSDDSYEALLTATDRLFKASARMRLELERVLEIRTMGSRKKAMR